MTLSPEGYYVVVFHPETLSGECESLRRFHALLASVEAAIASDATPANGAILIHPNADNEGRALAELLQTWVAEMQRAGAAVHHMVSVTRDQYLALVRHSAGLVGNSSSGVYEAPSLGVPTVNIGNRQKGRLMAASVVQATPDEASMTAALLEAAALGDLSNTVNPYGEGDTSALIIEALDGMPDFSKLLVKKFRDFA